MDKNIVVYKNKGKLVSNTANRIHLRVWIILILLYLILVLINNTEKQ
jgi:uncharacterized integral membrane protein